MRVSKKKELLTRKQKLLKEMKKITRMRQGKISEQFYKKTGKGGKKKSLGPYYLLQCWKDGRNSSERIPPDCVDQVRGDVAYYDLFRKLCREFITVTEELTVIVDLEEK